MATSVPKRPLPGIRPPAQPRPAPPSALGSIGGALGTIALAVGVGMLGAYMLDLHAHTCDGCGNRWRHLGAFNVGDPTSHTCGKCGVVQWWKDGVPHVFRSSLQPFTPAMYAARLQESRGVRPLGLPSGASASALPSRGTPALPARTETATQDFDPTLMALATKENNR